jgi:hypothetical protein
MLIKPPRSDSVSWRIVEVGRACRASIWDPSPLSLFNALITVPGRLGDRVRLLREVLFNGSSPIPDIVNGVGNAVRTAGENIEFIRVMTPWAAIDIFMSPTVLGHIYRIQIRAKPISSCGKCRRSFQQSTQPLRRRWEAAAINLEIFESNLKGKIDCEGFLRTVCM